MKLNSISTMCATNLRVSDAFHFFKCLIMAVDCLYTGIYLTQVEVRNGVAMVLVMTCIPMDLMEQAFGWVRTCSHIANRLQASCDMRPT